jgi:ABC-2 type transport system permease protein
MWALYKKELLIYFQTILGYLFLAFFLFLTGAIFTVSHLFRGNQNFPAYLQVLTALFALIAPVLSMKSYSEEWQHKTDQLLFCQPIALHHIVLAKFLSILTIFSVILWVLLLYLSVVMVFGTPDWAHIVGAFVGFALFGATLLSLGQLISSYTEHQFLAAVVSFASILVILILTSIAPILPTAPFTSLLIVVTLTLLFSLRLYQKKRSWVLSLGIGGGFVALAGVLYLIAPTVYQGLIPEVLQLLSPLHRYQGFHQGIIALSDVAYFILAIFLLQYAIYTQMESHYYKEK